MPTPYEMTPHTPTYTYVRHDVIDASTILNVPMGSQPMPVALLPRPSGSAVVAYVDLYCDSCGYAFRPGDTLFMVHMPLPEDRREHVRDARLCDCCHFTDVED